MGMEMNYLSLEDFKKWVTKQKDNVARFNQPKISNLVGLAVESKLSAKRIAANIISFDGNLHEISEDFKNNGGQIVDVDGTTFIIEVSTGGFSIQRCFVKKKDLQ